MNINNQKIKSGALVSYVLLTYNQEKYIVEALNSALSQDYKELELIISDDCSNDNTVNLIKKTLENYFGQFKIILLEQKINTGICQHINNVVEKCSGEIIVMAAGDDMSKSNRVTTIIQCFSENSKVAGVWSNLNFMNEGGKLKEVVFTKPPQFDKTLSEFKKNSNCWVIGASLAVKKEVFSKFGKINSDALQEDGIMAFRSLLLGGLEYVHEPLVNYRIHGNNVSQTQDPMKRLKLQVKEHLLFESYLKDFLRTGLVDDVLNLKLINKFKLYKLRSKIFENTYIGYLYNVVRITLSKLKK